VSREAWHSSTLGLQLAQSCTSSINEVWSTLRKKTEESVALQGAVQDTMEMLHADLEQKVVQQAKLVEGLKQSLDRNTISFKEMCAKQEHIVVDVKQVREVVEDLEQSFGKEAILIKETCSEQQQLLVDVKEIQEAAKHECQERKQEYSALGSGIAELRVGLDRAFHHVAMVMTSQGIEVEGNQAATDGNDLRRAFPPFHTLFRS